MGASSHQNDMQLQGDHLLAVNSHFVSLEKPHVFTACVYCCCSLQKNNNTEFILSELE